MKYFIRLILTKAAGLWDGPITLSWSADKPFHCHCSSGQNTWRQLRWYSWLYNLHAAVIRCKVSSLIVCELPNQIRRYNNTFSILTMDFNVFMSNGYWRANTCWSSSATNKWLKDNENNVKTDDIAGEASAMWLSLAYTSKSVIPVTRYHMRFRAKSWGLE